MSYVRKKVQSKSDLYKQQIKPIWDISEYIHNDHKQAFRKYRDFLTLLIEKKVKNEEMEEYLVKLRDDMKRDKLYMSDYQGKLIVLVNEDLKVEKHSKNIAENIINFKNSIITYFDSSYDYEKLTGQTVDRSTSDFANWQQTNFDKGVIARGVYMFFLRDRKSLDDITKLLDGTIAKLQSDYIRAFNEHKKLKSKLK